PFRTTPTQLIGQASEDAFAQWYGFLSQWLFQVTGSTRSITRPQAKTPAITTSDARMKAALHPRENEVKPDELAEVPERGAPECSLSEDLAIRRRGKLLTRRRAPHTAPVKIPRDEPQQRGSAK